MKNNVENFMSDLSYDNLKLIKQACAQTKKITKLLDNVNKLCNYYLKKYNNDESIQLDIGQNDRINNFILQIKNLSTEELTVISSFFNLVYVITQEPQYFTIMQYINIVIYIKEQLEKIANNCMSEMDLELFEFYLKGMNKGILKKMNSYFEEDLEKLPEKVLKKIMNQGGLNE